MNRFAPIRIILLLLTLALGRAGFANIDTARHTSASQQALELIKNIKLPDSSIWWPNIKLNLFIENLKANITEPLKMYQGSNTNFCGYAAFSYLPLQDDPVGWTHFMLTLYLNGEAEWNNIVFRPSKEIHQAAGTLRFKGILDIRPADQLWFLALADHFRSYLNFFNRRFHPGSEDTFWAACNYGKFNRMIRQMLGWHVTAHGSDLFRPHFHDLFDYLTNCLQTGTTYLYVNNTYLHKKNHNKFRGSFPTHYIVLESITRLPGDGDRVDIIYWDYGGRTLRQVDLRFLKKILFGVSHCTPPQHS
ncbi:MAG TPA: hypothetical protein VHE34_07970 [Puia sp.]|uniref:hypothetical protein n=1 Tax=Puia sp. TaxID=2045100 RepID=UPI002C64AFFB|nr:hypothetical protein [Puia sp.]HVU95143.1 hypothetical protein [Puia sp.]